MPNYCPHCGTNVREFLATFYVERTYRSLEEMPAEVRALFEQGRVRAPSMHDEADS